MQIVIAARKALDNPIQESSARFCLAEAMNAEERGDIAAVQTWALKSLMYSVGVFSPIYKTFS